MVGLKSYQLPSPILLSFNNLQEMNKRRRIGLYSIITSFGETFQTRVAQVFRRIGICKKTKNKKNLDV
jgi:hypothetical protein